MPSLTERPGSGDGDSIGLTGKRRTRTFSLIVDAVTDDWFAKFSALLPEGSLHPKDRSMQLTEHTNVSQAAPLGYIVSAIYEPIPDVGVSGFGHWLLNAASNTGSERLFQELPDPDNLQVIRQVVGPTRYVKRDEIEGPPAGEVFYAKALKDGVVIDQELLAVTGANRPDGMDVVGGGTTLTLSRQFDNMKPETIFSVANFKRSVNSKEFIGGTSRRGVKKLGVFPKGTLLFTDFSISETFGNLPNARVTAFLYDVSLQFVYNEEGHTPLVRTDTFVDDAGFESVVTRTLGGIDEVKNEFRRYVSRNFSSLIGLFGA